MAISSDDHSADDVNEAGEIVEDASLVSIEAVLADPSSSAWLKAALTYSFTCDPVDALNDALVLAALLEARLRVTLQIDIDRS